MDPLAVALFGFLTTVPIFFVVALPAAVTWLVVFGMLVQRRAIFPSRRSAAAIGAISGAAYMMILIGIVNLLNAWSPESTRDPIVLSSAVLAAGLLGATFGVIQRIP